MSQGGRPASRRGGGPGRTVLVTTGLLLVTAVLVLVFVLRLSGRNGARPQGALGGRLFAAGRASVLAAEADRRPILFPDLLGRSRSICLAHQPGDARRGWVAYRADQATVNPTSRGAQCDLDPSATTTYPVVVDRSGRLSVDLNQPASPPP